MESKTQEAPQKPDLKPRRVVGMMSGTSVDGIDAALVEISGPVDHPAVKLLAFADTPFPPAVRERIFQLFDPAQATADRVGQMQFLLGTLYAQAALDVIEKAGLTPAEVDLIGSHGQTIWHAPNPAGPQDWAADLWPDGRPLGYTVQIGDGAVIAQRTGIPTVSDFRVADVAVGGQGAPLVPYTEYLLYRRQDETVLLQNIGGIGNITVLPAGGGPESVYAFDTGPGNMLIDGVMREVSGGELSRDEGGQCASRGRLRADLLSRLQEDPYYAQQPPKSTGREHFGRQYVEQIMTLRARLCVSDPDLLATVTDLTAWSIADAYRRFVAPTHPAKELVVSGGGSYNRTLLARLRERMEPYGVAVHTQEDLGLNSDAKEAVAFALLADCCVHGRPGNLPGVTGAERPVVMGKISPV